MRADPEVSPKVLPDVAPKQTKQRYPMHVFLCLWEQESFLEVLLAGGCGGSMKLSEDIFSLAWAR